MMMFVQKLRSMLLQRLNPAAIVSATIGNNFVVRMFLSVDFHHRNLYANVLPINGKFKQCSII
jgi:hypothetical protein